MCAFVVWRLYQLHVLISFREVEFLERVLLVGSDAVLRAPAQVNGALGAPAPCMTDLGFLQARRVVRMVVTLGLQRKSILYEPT